MALTGNVLTGLSSPIFQGLDIVSREQVGLIPAVARNAEASGAAKNQKVIVPIAPPAELYDVVPAAVHPERGNDTIGNTEMEIQYVKTASLEWTGEEMGYVGTNKESILAGQFAQRFRALANFIELTGAAEYKKFSRAYGTAGLTPFGSAITDSAQVRKLLADNGAPLSDLKLVLDSAAGANLRALGILTKANEAGTDTTLRNGVLGNLHGFELHESGQLLPHTPGLYTTGDTTGADEPVGETAIAVTSGAGDYVAGDVIWFGTDTAHKYVVVSATTSVITIAAPGLKVAVATGTAVNQADSFTPNMAFDRNAIILLARLPLMPEGGDSASDVMTVTDPISGIPFQVAYYKGFHSVHIEISVAFGWKVVKPEHTALLLG